MVLINLTGSVSSFVSEAVGLAFATGLHRSTREFKMDPVTLQVSHSFPGTKGQLLNYRSVPAYFGRCIPWIPLSPIPKDARHSLDYQNVSSTKFIT